MIDRFPDPIILELLDEAPQLRLVNKKLLSLAELKIRNRLLNYFDFSDKQVDELAADVHDNLHSASWRVVEDVAQKDYCFFGPEHVVKLGEDGFTNAAPSSHDRGYQPINGAPWGLYVMKWSNQYLEYTTRLRAGYYGIYLNVFAPQLHELSCTKFSVVNSPSTKQYFRSSPPLSWLYKQLPQTSSSETHLSTPPSEDDIAYSNTRSNASLDFETPTLYVGSIDVESEGTSEWVDVSIRIEKMDWSQQFSGIIFNYLYFKPLSPEFDETLDWTFRLKEPVTEPTHALSIVYKRANARKRRWSNLQEGYICYDPERTAAGMQHTT